MGLTVSISRVRFQTNPASVSNLYPALEGEDEAETNCDLYHWFGWGRGAVFSKGRNPL